MTSRWISLQEAASLVHDNVRWYNAPGNNSTGNNSTSNNSSTTPFVTGPSSQAPSPDRPVFLYPNGDMYYGHWRKASILQPHKSRPYQAGIYCAQSTVVFVGHWNKGQLDGPAALYWLPTSPAWQSNVDAGSCVRHPVTGQGLPFLYFGHYNKDKKNDPAATVILKDGTVRVGPWQDDMFVGADWWTCHKKRQPKSPAEMAVLLQFGWDSDNKDNNNHKKKKKTATSESTSSSSSCSPVGGGGGGGGIHPNTNNTNTTASSSPETSSKREQLKKERSKQFLQHMLLPPTTQSTEVDVAANNNNNNNKKEITVVLADRGPQRRIPVDVGSIHLRSKDAPTFHRGPRQELIQIVAPVPETTCVDDDDDETTEITVPDPPNRRKLDGLVSSPRSKKPLSRRHLVAHDIVSPKQKQKQSPSAQQRRQQQQHPNDRSQGSGYWAAMEPPLPRVSTTAAAVPSSSPNKPPTCANHSNKRRLPGGWELPEIDPNGSTIMTEFDETATGKVVLELDHLKHVLPRRDEGEPVHLQVYKKALQADREEELEQLLETPSILVSEKQQQQQEEQQQPPVPTLRRISSTKKVGDDTNGPQQQQQQQRRCHPSPSRQHHHKTNLTPRVSSPPVSPTTQSLYPLGLEPPAAEQQQPCAAVYHDEDDDLRTPLGLIKPTTTTRLDMETPLGLEPPLLTMEDNEPLEQQQQQQSEKPKPVAAQPCLEPEGLSPLGLEVSHIRGGTTVISALDIPAGLEAHLGGIPDPAYAMNQRRLHDIPKGIVIENSSPLRSRVGKTHRVKAAPVAMQKESKKETHKETTAATTKESRKASSRSPRVSGDRKDTKRTDKGNVSRQSRTTAGIIGKTDISQMDAYLCSRDTKKTRNVSSDYYEQIRVTSEKNRRNGAISVAGLKEKSGGSVSSSRRRASTRTSSSRRRSHSTRR